MDDCPALRLRLIARALAPRPSRSRPMTILPRAAESGADGVPAGLSPRFSRVRLADHARDQ